MIISLMILFFITFILSVVFYFAERSAQADVFESWWSCIIWAATRYIDGGDGVFEGAPVTIVGRIVAFMLGIIGIAIVAIPAGLIGSGFMDAIADEKRDNELNGYKENLEMAFRGQADVNFREYLKQHPDLCKLETGKSGYYLPAYIPLPKLLIRYGMDFRDVFDTVTKYPQFRIANLAAMHSLEENPDDRLILTHQYINAPYGCFINRGSKITIVSTSSVLETLTGWFAHTLSMVGGFNLISKEVEPNIGDFDSYAAMEDTIKVFGYTKEELLKEKSKNASKLKLYAQKEENRKAFMSHLTSVCQGEDSWLIFINTSIKSSTNTLDFHFTESGKAMVIEANAENYKSMVQSIAEMLNDEFGYVAALSDRYPLGKNCPARKIGENAVFNAFKINVGAPVLLDPRKIITIHKLAQSINNALGGSGMTAYDAHYLTTRHYGLRDYTPNA
ncbi:MAG: hypothetical protein MR881_01445 [Bacteroidales bacterium]|nr:hypothetical protein [Bacteroidales bacterium]